MRTLEASSHTGPLHRPRDLRILHEPLPRISGSQVLRAQERDPGVKPENVGRDPPVGGMKSGGEAIAAVDLAAEPLLHCLKRGDADVRRKHQRAGWSTR